MTRLPNTESRLFARFLYLAGIELILASAWTLVIKYPFRNKEAAEKFSE